MQPDEWAASYVDDIVRLDLDDEDVRRLASETVSLEWYEGRKVIYDKLAAERTFNSSQQERTDRINHQLDIELAELLRIEEWKKHQPRFKVLADAEVDSIKPAKFLLEGWLVQDTVAELFADEGVGKSFLALDWAYHISAGAPWMGYEIAEPANVVYVYAEGVSGLPKRRRAWRQAHPDLDTSRVTFIPAPVNVFKPDEVNAFVHEVVEKLRPALVIFDTKLRCTEGARENEADDVGVIVNGLDRIRAVNRACILFLHHPGKQEKTKSRGSSAWPQNIDTDINLTSDSVKFMGGVSLRLTQRKQKDHELITDFALRRQIVTLDDDSTSCVIALGLRSQQEQYNEEAPASVKAMMCLETLKKVIAGSPEVYQHGVPQTIWANAIVQTNLMGLSTFNNHYLKELTKKRLVRRIEDGRNVSYSPVELPTDGEES